MNGEKQPWSWMKVKLSIFYFCVVLNNKENKHNFR